MKRSSLRRLWFLVIIVALFANGTGSLFAQARRTPPTSDQKKNKRPPEGGQQPTDEKAKEPVPTDIIGKPQEGDTVKVSTNLVNVDAVVYNKKTGQVQPGLHKGNFQIFVDGEKKDITNFATPEAPITVTLVVEYSKIGQLMGYYGSSGQEAGQLEVPKLERFLGVLATLAYLAPLLGLLGTVTGIIDAFGTLSSNGGYATVTELSNGVYKSLLTTAAGLVVATPTFVAYSYLSSRVNTLMHEMERAGRLNHPKRMPRLYGQPDELNRFVGGDPSGYTNENPRHELRMTRKAESGESATELSAGS